MRRLAAIFCLALVPEPALAHAAERGLILLLPTEYYLAGGATAVAVSFAVLALAPGGWAGRLARWRWALPRIGLPTGWLAWLGFLAFWGLIAVGLLGPRDPLKNLLPLTVWTLWWVGFTLAVAVVGDLWRPINPWSAPVRLLRRLARLPGPWPMPARLGYWPAVAGFGAAAWFEIVDIAPDDPARLAWAAIAYWAVQLAAMLAFGEAAWLRQGEAFSVFFRLIAKVAVLGREARAAPAGTHAPRPTLSLPGARLVGARALPVSGWLFVCLTIAAVTFDGLAGTFWWLGQIGVNPLEFPGRSAVVAPNTAGLVAVWLAMCAAYLAAVAGGWALAGGAAPLSRFLGRTALSLLPIALAYHFSHYLTILMVNGQYALAALSDPLGSGADWLGFDDHDVTTSFLNTLDGVRAIWRVQVAAIVAGHLLAVAVAHAIATELFPDRRRAALSQLPLAALMVGYTALGLWLLSTPTSV